MQRRNFIKKGANANKVSSQFQGKKLISVVNNVKHNQI